ncbi:unnamed protein product [Oncorhynchus mykiss]|uniref:RRM domain-containing protein n=1 Tax=Oncorhynchus mykiss TaxID=8022 RepID=A0A060Z7C0_ONCMY|nr:unnamed protein product [Oncorhynchus mykiss]
MVTRTKKIFVGGLSANTVVEDVKQYFEQFGKVRRIIVGSSLVWSGSWQTMSVWVGGYSYPVTVLGCCFQAVVYD